MKFVKANLDLLIAGLLVLLAVCAYFWPLSPWKEDLRNQAKERHGKENSVQSYIARPQKPIVIPGVGSIPDGPNDPHGLTATYTDNLAKAKGAAQEQMKVQADKVIQVAAVENSKKRVRIVTTKGPQGNTEHVIPLLSDGKVPQDHLLPTAKRGTFGFRDDYLKQFAQWEEKLGHTPLSSTKGLQDQIERRLKEQNEMMLKNNAPVGTVGAVGATGSIALSPEKVAEIRRSEVSKRAASVRMYVDENAFPKPEWARSDVRNPLTETQMFDALGCSWLINDMVNAIAKVNDDALAASPQAPQNVGTSPIKRLEAITIGPSGGTMGFGAVQGSFFLTGSTSMNVVAGGFSAPTGGGDRTMTGLVSDENYGVTLLSVKVVIDPAYVGRLIEEIYRQNNGYAVLSIKTTHVDPLDSAGNGYLYGKTQVVRVDIQLENLMFRKWLDPILPKDYTRQLTPTGTMYP